MKDSHVSSHYLTMRTVMSMTRYLLVQSMRSAGKRAILMAHTKMVSSNISMYKKNPFQF